MKFSIITAVYNNRETIGDALASFQSQTHPDKEHIVIDGLSTDGTLDVLKANADRIAVLVSEKDNGIYSALNKGILRSGGDVIGFLHSDDLYSHERVLEDVDELFRRTGADAVYGDVIYIDKIDPERIVRNWRAGDFHPDSLRNGWMPPHPAFFVRREIYQRLGGFDEGFRIAGDYDCILRILGSKGLKVSYLPERLLSMRLGGASNRSLKAIIRKSREDYRALRRNRTGGLMVLLKKNLRKVPQFIFK